MPRATGLIALVLAAAVGGCGSTGGEQRSGRALFAQDCSACHSLSGRQSQRRQGGDLLALRVGRQALLQFVREMPVRHPLGPAELRSVTAYVLSVERRGRSG
jgi:mono/diheme cytochrome c family protein